MDWRGFGPSFHLWPFCDAVVSPTIVLWADLGVGLAACVFGGSSVYFSGARLVRAEIFRVSRRSRWPYVCDVSFQLRGDGVRRKSRSADGPRRRKVYEICIIG